MLYTNYDPNVKSVGDSVISEAQNRDFVDIKRVIFSYMELKNYLNILIEELDFSKTGVDALDIDIINNKVQIFPEKIYRILKSGGKLVFTVEHPVFTAYGTQDWHYNEKGEILHFPVDNYYYEGKRTAVFLGEKVTKYHRTLTTYLNTLLSNGFIINHIVEPQPPENMMDIPGMQDEMRRPMMLIVSANKKVDR